MRLGKLNRLISIDQKVVTQDASFGTEEVIWDRVTRCMAEVVVLQPSVSEGVARSALVVSRAQFRIRTRWRDDINSSMRVVLHGGGNDRILQIVGGPNEFGGRKEGLEMVCEEISS